MQRLTYIINWSLHTTINPYQYQAHSMGSHNSISKQNLIHLGLRHNKWPRKVFLRLLEGQDTFFGPLKSLPLIQQLEERSAFVR